MLQWFISFPEFADFTEILFYLGKTQMFLFSKQDVVWAAIQRKRANTPFRENAEPAGIEVTPTQRLPMNACSVH